MTIMIKDNLTGKIEVIPNIKSVHASKGDIFFIKKDNVELNKNKK